MRIFESKITSQEIETMELAVYNGNVSIISSENEDFNEAIKYLSLQKIIGFDTETKPCFIQKTPRNKMAILQLAGDERAFIFKLQHVGVPRQLAKLLSNPNIIKVGAAVHDDIKGLQEYCRFEPKGFVDLQKISGDYGIEEKSVRKMAAIILNKKVSKSQQLSNWETAQLSEAQIRYAAVDAWICKEMYEELQRNK